MRDARETGNAESQRVRKHGSGFSLIELLVVVAVILIIAAIAVPNLIRSKIAANEASAVASMHVILTASNVYYANYSNGYPPSMAAMGGPPAAVPTCNQGGLLDAVLVNAPNQKSGYTFSYTGQGAPVTAPAGCAAPGFAGFVTTAVPIKIGISGGRSFCTTEDGVIHFDVTGAVIATEAACLALPSL